MDTHPINNTKLCLVPSIECRPIVQQHNTVLAMNMTMFMGHLPLPLKKNPLQL